MSYGETKVYHDGSHYIAIPHTTRPSRPRRKTIEDEITVVENDAEQTENSVPADNADTLIPHTEEKETSDAEMPIVEPVKVEKKMTRKELFNQLYKEYFGLTKANKRKKLIEALRPYFKSEEVTVQYVEINMERKLRNLISRRIRCTRKANLQDFNYFVTFTYDNAKHTEETFRKQLKGCLSHFSSRKGWKYIGVWERAPKTNRLHFHGIFYIPDGTMPGEVIPFKDYSFATHKPEITYQNLYFNERFGRSDFETIDEKNKLYDAITYILKYLEKTGEKIVFSKGLPQFFISDIMDEDVVCPIGLEDKKLLLFDGFTCWDEGELIGKVSTDTIKRLRKCN